MAADGLNLGLTSGAIQYCFCGPRFVSLPQNLVAPTETPRSGCSTHARLLRSPETLRRTLRSVQLGRYLRPWFEAYWSGRTLKWSTSIGLWRFYGRCQIQQGQYAMSSFVTDKCSEAQLNEASERLMRSFSPEWADQPDIGRMVLGHFARTGPDQLVKALMPRCWDELCFDKLLLESRLGQQQRVCDFVIKACQQ